MEHEMKNLFHVFLCICFGLSSFGAAATIQANSCSQTDVQAAISIAHDGDTIQLPVGSGTWRTPASNTPAVLLDAKSLFLRGAGIGKTVITDSTGTQWGEYALSINSVEGKPFRVSGISFVCLGTSSNIRIVGTCKTWRIDHCEFNSTILNGTILIGGLSVTDYLNGLIDNCIFNNSNIVILFGDGNHSWKQPMDLGSTDAVYIEDCRFIWNVYGNSIDCDNGARYVARYNTFVNTSIAAHSLQNATSSQVFSRGTRSVEIYHNQFTTANSSPVVGNYFAIDIRAGTGVIYSNRVTNGQGDPYNLVIGVDNVRCESPPPSFLGLCDGSNPLDGNTPVAGGTGTHTGANMQIVLTCSGKTWSPNSFDSLYVYNLTDGSLGLITANTGTTVTASLGGGARNAWNAGDIFKITNGYPCLDQIGRSTDHGQGTDRQPQDSVPLYAWDNTMDGVVAPIEVINGPKVQSHIMEGRDIISSNNPKPGYSPLQYPHPLRSGDTGSPSYKPQNVRSGNK